MPIVTEDRRGLGTVSVDAVKSSFYHLAGFKLEITKPSAGDGESGEDDAILDIELLHDLVVGVRVIHSSFAAEKLLISGLTGDRWLCVWCDQRRNGIIRSGYSGSEPCLTVTNSISRSRPNS